MESTGLPVGLLAGRGHTEQAVQLAAGDVIFFYTDGCVEAENEAGDMFGAERLEALLRSPMGGADDSPENGRVRRQRLPRPAGTVRRRDDDGGRSRVRAAWSSAGALVVHSCA